MPASIAQYSPSQGFAAVPGTTAVSLPIMLWDADSNIPSWAGQQTDEPFNVKQFLESRTAPYENAAPLYFAALADLGSDMYVGPDVPASWPWRLPAPPQIVALGEDVGRLSDLSKLRSGEIPQSEVARVLDAAHGAIVKLDLAQHTQNCIFFTGTQADSLLPHAQSCRSFARLAQLQIYWAGVTEDLGLAERAIGRTLRLSRDLRPRGVVISQMVANAIDGVVFAAMQEITLGQQRLDAAGCDRLLAMLAEHERKMVPARVEGLRMEYISMRNALDLLQRGEVTNERIAQWGLLIGNQPLAPHSIEQFRKTELAMQIAATNRCFGVLLTAADLPHQRALATKPWEGELGKLKNQGAYLSALMLPGLDALILADANRKTRQAGLECLIATRRFYVTHNGPPPDLETAFREAGLAAVPTDPYSGRPMRFTLVDRKPVVYSVGSDMQDNGASVDNRGAPMPGDWLFTLNQ